MILTVNGQSVESAVEATVRDLIVRFGMEGKAVAVEVNEELVPRRDHETRRLRPGDRVELVTLIGGG